jgi:hypothetical protein
MVLDVLEALKARKWQGRTKRSKRSRMIAGGAAYMQDHTLGGGSAKVGSFAPFSLPCWIEISWIRHLLIRDTCWIVKSDKNYSERC